MALLMIGQKIEIEHVASLIVCHEPVDCILYTDDSIAVPDKGFDFYRCIILAFYDSRISDKIYELLTGNVGIDGAKILDFYRLYRASVPLMVAERRMLYPKVDKYDGMILGISHAETGIISGLLKYPFCNLAVSSQDIYYNLQSFKYCIENNYSKVSGLKYLIFDMYDYTYFNYDTSLSSNLFSYFMFGGFNTDEHNFKSNKNNPYGYTYENLLDAVIKKRYYNINDGIMDLWDGLFGNAHERDGYRALSDYIGLNGRIKCYEEKDNEELIEKTKKKQVFPETVKENMQCFKEILRLAYEINPDIKIYAIIMPRYYAIYEKIKEAAAAWKERFNECIEEAAAEYPFKLYDLSEHELSKHIEYYYDESHFNYAGAVKFTEWINNNLL